MKLSKKLLTSLLLAGLANVAFAGTITVNTVVDEDNANTSGPNAGQGCSLREAIQAVNNQLDGKGCTGVTAGGPNVIDITLSTIANPIIVNKPALNTNGNTIGNGNLDPITANAGDVTINQGRVTCDTQNGSRLFTIGNGANVTFTNVGLGIPLAIPPLPIAGIPDINNLPGVPDALLSCQNNTTGVGVSVGANATFKMIGGDMSNLHNTNGTIGGAMDVAGGGQSIYLIGVNFIGNSVKGGVDNGAGGAIGVTGTINKFFAIGNTFLFNQVSGSGGAISFDAIGDAAIISNVFYKNAALAKNGDNNAKIGGGAIFARSRQNYDTDPFLINNSYFMDNSAGEDGGAQVGRGGAILFGGSSFAGYPLGANFAAVQGVPVGFTDPFANFTQFLTDLITNNWTFGGGIVGSHFLQNNAYNGDGGAIFSQADYLTIVSSSFLNNGFTITGPSVNNGGAIAIDSVDASFAGEPADSTNIIANVTMSGNTVKQKGGAIAHLSGSDHDLKLINVTLNDNHAANGGTNDGGSALFAASPVHVLNSFLGDSINGDYSDTKACDATLPANIIDDTSTHNIQFSLAANPLDISCGATFVTKDPRFKQTITPGLSLAFPLISVFELLENSPASGAGDQTVCDASPINKTDATYRLDVRPAGYPVATPVCDIGSYESASTTPVTLQSFSVE